jgi:hypothetical protein
MYLRFPIFKLIPSSSQVVFAPLQKNVLMSFQCKLLSQQLCKATSLTYDLGSISNYSETWNIMSTTIFQIFNSFNFIKWEILLLPWNHLKLRPKHKMTYTSLSPTSNSLIFWETHKMYVFYIYSKFQLYWWWSQKVITLKKTDFKTKAETLDTWIFFNTYPNDMKCLSHI